MDDIKGSFKVIKPNTIHADESYYMVFLKDRILFIKSGVKDWYTGSLNMRQLFESIGIFFGAFIVTGIILVLLVWILYINSVLPPISALISPLVLLISLIAGIVVQRRFEYKIASRQSTKRNSINMNIIRDKSISEALALDKSNYEIFYRDIVIIKINNSHFNWHARRAGELTIISGIPNKLKEKLNIDISENYPECRNIVSSALPDKLSEK
jgi:hypothetical protein